MKSCKKYKGSEEKLHNVDEFIGFPFMDFTVK